MGTMKARDVLNGLGKKGFCRSDSDHSHLILYVDGKKTEIRTKVSHGSIEINDRLINLMSIQLHLERKDFMNLVYCPLTLADYLKELAKKGFIFK